MRGGGRVRLAVVTALVTLLIGAASGLAQQPAPSRPDPIIIKELAVEGNRRVQEAVILGRIRSTVGGSFSPAALSEDLRAVFGLGFFDDVQLRVEDFEGGVKVTFVVVERPFIRDVQFVGNKVSATDLQEKIDIKLGSVYNPVEIQRAKQKLAEYYEDEGYFEVQITPSTEKFEDGDVKVVFTINEGRKMTIGRIVFRGNKGLSERELKGRSPPRSASTSSCAGLCRGSVSRRTSSGSSPSTTTTATSRRV